MRGKEAIEACIRAITGVAAVTVILVGLSWLIVCLREIFLAFKEW